jgi:hypothetical protein
MDETQIRAIEEEAATLWRLTVHGAELPGLWVVIDREFRAEG